jgi:RES domain-containing protein
VILWRICRAVRAANAFDGEGARLYPGRWNGAGVPVVYCSSSLSLATIEMLVHVDPGNLPLDLVVVRAELPDSVKAERIDRASLPADWREYPGPTSLQELGSQWAASLRTAALVVPSVITPIEDNVLLNPRRPDAARIVAGAPEPFAFDPRLLKVPSRRRP